MPVLSIPNGSALAYADCQIHNSVLPLQDRLDMPDTSPLQSTPLGPRHRQMLSGMRRFEGMLSHFSEASTPSPSPTPPRTSVLSTDAHGGAAERCWGNASRNAMLDDVVVNLRSYVEQRRTQIG